MTTAMAGIAINIGANTNEPGFRAPVWPDGSFEYIPIPESEQTVESVPTYGDLEEHLETTIPEHHQNTPVHLDPEFPEYPFCDHYTYGDEHSVKASRLTELSAGDDVFFYATLTVARKADWLPPTWGAFVIGQFKLARDPITGEEYDRLGADERALLANNAHTKRDPVDARVFLRGDPGASQLYETAVPLSRPEGGTEPNWLVTECSDDSGRGPWWRRPLRFNDASKLVEMTAVPPDNVTEVQQ